MTRVASGSAAMNRLSGTDVSLAGRHADARLESVGGGVRPSMVRLSAISANLKARGADPMLFTYCPIDDLTSAQGMGGWNNDAGWDDDIGWKD